MGDVLMQVVLYNGQTTAAAAARVAEGVEDY